MQYRSSVRKREREKEEKKERAELSHRKGNSSSRFGKRERERTEAIKKWAHLEALLVFLNVVFFLSHTHIHTVTESGRSSFCTYFTQVLYSSTFLDVPVILASQLKRHINDTGIDTTIDTEQAVTEAGERE